MGVLLEIKAGPFAGKVIALTTGQSRTFGRAEGRAEFALPYDTFMSGLHFAVECGPQGCRVVDRKSSNGTFLNGARIQDAMLANGDEIKGGQTVFAVKVVADAKLASLDAPQDVSPVPPVVPPPAPPKPRRGADSKPAPVQPAPPVPPPVVHPGGKLPVFSVMGWSFFTTPEKWQIQEEFGLQRTGDDAFPSSVAVSEELLGGITLQQFVESQISMLRQYLRDPKIEPTMPPKVGGAEESMAVDVRHSTKDGRELVYRRIYARSGASVGVLTVTTLAAELPQVLQSLQPLLDGAAFRSTVNN